MRKLTLSILALAFFAAPAFAGEPIYIDDDVQMPTEGEEPIPEPTAALLLGAGLATVGIATRRRR